MRPFAILALLLALGGTALGGDAVPQGLGLAAKFPFDAGIERHPSVLLHETFEGNVGGLKSRWTEVKNKDGKVLSMSPDVPPGSGGRQSLLIHSIKGRDSGGHLWKCFKPGVDTMYGRFYVKFAKDHPYVHHFVKIGAWRDATRWPAGEAGYKHDGSKSFQTGIEPGSGWGKYTPPGAWFLYTYWCEMRSYGGGNFYGNAFAPQKPSLIPRGRWQCIEFMVKANDFPKEDGEQAFWVDGRLIGRWAPGTPTGSWKSDKYRIGGGQPFKGFKWRTDNSLKINTFWLLHYMAAVWRGSSQFKKHPDTSETESKVWFDDVVVATEYIGPIVGKKQAAEAKRPSGGIIAPPKREPKIKADAEKEAALRQKLAELIKAGAAKKKPRIYIDFGGRSARAKLLGADDSGIRVSMSGMEMPLPWKQIKPNRLYGIAAKLTDDHGLLADYCEAAGLVEEFAREKALAK